MECGRGGIGRGRGPDCLRCAGQFLVRCFYCMMPSSGLSFGTFQSVSYVRPEASQMSDSLGIILLVNYEPKRALPNPAFGQHLRAHYSGRWDFAGSRGGGGASDAAVGDGDGGDGDDGGDDDDSGVLLSAVVEVAVCGEGEGGGRRKERVGPAVAAFCVRGECCLRGGARDIGCYFCGWGSGW